MLMRFDPFRELDRLTQDLWGVTGSLRAARWPMDAYRRSDQVVVHVDLPGVDPASIDVHADRNVLTLRAERSWTPGDGDEVLVAERPHGTFERQLFLGDGLDLDQVQARYEHGVLTLTIPVAETAKPRRIEVTSGAGTEESAAIEASSKLAS